MDCDLVSAWNELGWVHQNDDEIMRRRIHKNERAIIQFIGDKWGI